MIDLLLPYLIGTLITTVTVVVAVLAFVHHRQSSLRYDALVARLPDAVRWADLSARVIDLQLQRDQIDADVRAARAIVQRKEAAEAWLAENAERHARMVEEIPQLIAKIKQLRPELERLATENTDQGGRLAQVLRDLATRQDEYQKLSASVSRSAEQLEHVSIAANARTAELAALEARVAETTARLDERAAALQASAEDAVRLADEIATARDTLSAARAERTEAERNHADLAERARLLSVNLGDLERDAVAATQSVERLRGLEMKLNADVSRLDERCDEAEAELRETDELVRAARGDLDATTEKLEQVRAEHERRRAEIGEMKQHFDALQQRIAESAKLVPVTQASEEEKLAELWTPFLDDLSDKKYKPTSPNELDALDATSAYLTASGLHFPQRVVRAFHTTLKVADISPLVVLSGISGTGKSELPRRYAESMGMHFLNMAVQPRWDSPQDMFGFYNYLDNRYRATELARALVQMDPYAGRPGRGWQCPPGWIDANSRDNQMLIVLLDEMNLARVEYYFSEFLSRLETRRGVRATDASDRKKAEISLEVGMGQMPSSKDASKLATKPSARQPTMQLFVDRNVMFVGTMNEDESTQTLSDKVIDRANMLRFGRPSNLKRRPLADSPAAPQRFLSYDQWGEWLKQETVLNDSAASDVTRWIDTLNAAMTQVRRPFAFRTAQAIRSYVANYPDVDAYRDAMADQVEFKILPRLRGLDLSESANKSALHEVRRLVEGDLKDTRLAAGIQDCEHQGHGDSQFTWHGLDRTEQPA